ncbi:hypothetical protein HK098_004295 [Nowakowskiella sp. JEL0407]|nr:hypothetical protein HK098_004295 [Nowakowskiella sp. JEL0407]
MIPGEEHFEWETGKKLIYYHTNWATYGRNFQVKDLPIHFISDVNYAFLDLKTNNSGFFIPTLTDAWADTDKRFTGPDEGVPPPDTWNEGPDTPKVFGNFGQFLKLKKLGCKFNLGVSVGGWTCSKNFSDAVCTPQSRQAFVDALIAFFDKYPGLFNRVDIDWEYISPPGENWGDGGNKVRKEDPQNFAALLHLLKTRLIETGRSQYEISACVSGDPKKYDILPLQAMCQYLDTINVMTYDFASSSWGPCAAGHQTNLKSTPYATLSVENAVQGLLQRGVPPHKIVIGSAFYSRGFANTNGLGHPSHGVVPDKSWEEGVVDYKQLPLPGATEHWDDAAKATYSYDPVKRVLNSYDK